MFVFLLNKQDIE